MIKFNKIQNNYQEHFKTLIEALKNDKDIAALYVFGSRAEKRVKPLSDIDLAVLLADSFPKEKYSEKKLTLLNKIIDILKTDEIDLVILNNAPPVLSFEIIKKGGLVFSANESERIKAQVSFLNQYFDILPKIIEYNKYMHLRIKEGKFGA